MKKAFTLLALLSTASGYPPRSSLDRCLSKTTTLQLVDAEISRTELGKEQSISVGKWYRIPKCLANVIVSIEDGTITLTDRSRLQIDDGTVRRIDKASPMSGPEQEQGETPLIDGHRASIGMLIERRSITGNVIQGWIGVWRDKRGSLFAYYAKGAGLVGAPRILFSMEAAVSDVRMGLGLPDVANVPISFVARDRKNGTIVGSVHWPSSAETTNEEAEKLVHSSQTEGSVSGPTRH